MGLVVTAVNDNVAFDSSLLVIKRLSVSFNIPDNRFKFIVLGRYLTHNILRVPTTQDECHSDHSVVFVLVRHFICACLGKYPVSFDMICEF